MESEIFGQHISRKFNADLENLRAMVSTMGGLVERQLSQAVEAMVSADSELGLEVARRDVEVNQMEVKIDEELLNKVANMTDGKYYRATDNTRLKEVYQEIDQLEKSKIDVTEFRKKHVSLP